MKLAIPTNWDDSLFERIDYPAVDYVYGKLDREFIGGGRPSCLLGRVSRARVKKHIGLVAKKGFRFYYLLNASCSGNREWTIAGQRSLEKTLDWISIIGAQGVVVASPYLAQYIIKKYPQLKISVSCFANVNSVERAIFWEDLGASGITLSQVETNRDFNLLQNIRKRIKCNLQLIVNDNCLQGCPFFTYHNNIVSHASETPAKLGSYIFDYCRLMCRYKMLSEPSNFISAVWIRPEDLEVYENIGIDSFKLLDRTMDTDSLAEIIKAYAERQYRGNLYDLFTDFSTSYRNKKAMLLHKYKYFFHPFMVNIFKSIKRRKIVSRLEVFIDNTKLDGFIDHFLNNSCRSRSCKECGYCHSVAQKAICINEEYRAKTISDYQGILKEIISGDLFHY